MKAKYIIIFFGVVFLFLIYQLFRRKSEIEEYGVKGLAKVIDIKRVSKGITTGQTLVFFNYKVKNKLYKNNTDKYPNVEIGDCYEITYSSRNPEVVKIYFNKKISCSEYEVGF